MHCQIPQECERDGFLGVARKKQVVEATECMVAAISQVAGEGSHESRVMTATTRRDDFDTPRNPPSDRVGDAPDGQLDGGSDSIRPGHLLVKSASVPITKSFPAGALGRLGREEWIGQQLREDVFMRATLSRQETVAVVGSALVDQFRQRVDHRDTGPRIEREHTILLRAPHDVCEIRHAAEVQQNAGGVRRREQKHIGHRHQRSALTASRHVTGTKTTHYRNTKSFGQNGRLA
jgi:hypothetical protein